MGVACVHIANLALQVALIENPHLDEQPVVIGGSPFDDGSVFDVSPEAMAYGIKIGMTLRKAYSLCPGPSFFRGMKYYVKAFLKRSWKNWMISAPPWKLKPLIAPI